MRVLRRTKGNALLLLVVAGALVFAHIAVAQDGNQEKKARQLYEEGRAAFEKGQFEEAIKKYEESIKLNPKDDDAYYGLGRAYAKAGQIGKAEEAFRKCLELNPQRADAKTALQKIRSAKESKRAAERICERYGAVVARIFNVYGEGKEGGVIETFINRALAGQPLVVNSSQVRDFIYVDDVCEALWLLAQKAEPGFYDVGTGVPTPVDEVARLVIELTGSSSPIEVRPAEPSISVADVRALREMGFEPKVGLREGVRRVVDFLRQRAGSPAMG